MVSIVIRGRGAAAETVAGQIADMRYAVTMANALERAHGGGGKRFEIADCACPGVPAARGADAEGMARAVCAYFKRMGMTRGDADAALDMFELVASEPELRSGVREACAGAGVNGLGG